MNLKRFKCTTTALAILLAVQLLVIGSSSASAKVIEQSLPEPEWIYKLPKGYTLFTTYNSIQSKDRVFFHLQKKVALSPSKFKNTTFVYGSVDRKGDAHWLYDYYDIAKDKAFSGSDPYYSKDGYSYFYKRNVNGTEYILSGVDPNGKLKWTKKITNPFDMFVLDSGNILIYYTIYYPSSKTSIRFFEEYTNNGHQVRKLKIDKGGLTTGTLKVLPNGFIMHSSDQGQTRIYRSLNALKTPLAQYNTNKIEVMPFSGGSFLVYLSSKKEATVTGFNSDGKKKWVRTLNPKDKISITGNNYLIQSNNVYSLFSKDNLLLGKQQFGKIGDTDWESHITSSGEITVEKQYQWQERPSVIDENNFKGDSAKEDFYVLDPEDLQIKYHLTTLWYDIDVGHDYIYAGNGELYLTDRWYRNTLTKYILK
ncbi:hypothetical protein [Paenibacillus sp. ALJ109b]|uniref:hypothetical protein n=1 Tax=Paenibacillus sp. ALJ109b TaxID=2709068 RepID=UPI0013D33560|nr:hypothetical protein [Paenibacillus sp. ALJ109b]NEU64523.1 hypothetical protein [Paenibacillus sp. ALJ109b]